MARKSLRYQSGNQNPNIEEQTTQWPKDKVQKDKRHTKHTHKTTDRATRTPLKTGGELDVLTVGNNGHLLSMSNCSMQR